MSAKALVRPRTGLLIAALVAALIGMTLVAAPADAKNEKVDVCHITGNGSFQLINVSENAVRAHVDHGDGLIGDPVPGMAGYAFGEDCVPVRTALVTAYSTNAAGTTRVVSELLDTNGDGKPSAGDTAMMYSYPTNFDATSYAAYPVSECVLDDFVLYTVDNGQYLQAFGQTLPTTGYCLAYWVDYYNWNDADQYEQFLFQTYDSSNSNFLVVEIFDGLGYGRDTINVYGNTQQRENNTDDGFLDIVFNLPFTP